MTFVRPLLMCLTLVFSGGGEASTIDDIRALESVKAPNAPAPALRPLLSHNTEVKDATAPTQTWFPLSDGRRVNVAEWKVVLFMQSTCGYCHKFDPLLNAFSHQTGLSVFPFSMDGKGDETYPDVLPATPDVMVDFFKGGLPVATPTTFLTNVNTMETYPLLQGAVDTPALRARIDEVFRLALDRKSTSKREPRP